LTNTTFLDNHIKLAESTAMQNALPVSTIFYKNAELTPYSRHFAPP